jgi:hypothetical protein
VTLVTRCVAIAVAVCLASPTAWGHSFPPVRTVVVQVEADGLAVLVGYRPGSGDATDNVVARAASQPKSRVLDTLREVMEAYALAPLAFTLDGKPLVPTSVRAKLAVEQGTGRPSVVVLVTYKTPVAGRLAVVSKDARSTRISWQDRAGCRVDLGTAPAQDRWFTGVASFLLTLGAPCVPSRSESLPAPP